ncbi:hypothetical protein GCM10023080_078750 [Streptomyces pseudoechinosporeus]
MEPATGAELRSGNELAGQGQVAGEADADPLGQAYRIRPAMRNIIEVPMPFPATSITGMMPTTTTSGAL